LQETCQALGTAVDKTLMIGDTWADWEMAKQAKSAACRSQLVGNRKTIKIYN
jgi:phosphoglycolate phosphatase-like HAD superfamily hydrolase